MTNRSATKSKTSAEALEELFQALGDRTRLRLLNLMANGEVCVCFFIEVLDQPQPKISRHLAYLRNAGLVAARREAKWMHYTITPPMDATVRAALDAVMAALKADREMQKDRDALARACCSPRVPEQLRRAPRPGLVRTLNTSARQHVR
jgi:ArsR family transcriptional regulator